MTLNIKDPNTKVWIMQNNVPTEVLISEISINVDASFVPRIFYTLREPGKEIEISEKNFSVIRFSEDKIFNTKEDLLKSL